MDEQGEGGVRIGAAKVPDYLRPTYANFATVTHTPWDFRMLFAVLRAPNPGPEAEAAAKRGALEQDAVAEIIIPANLMVGFITALQQNFDKYIQQYGRPRHGPQRAPASVEWGRERGRHRRIDRS
jgi:hypothetical protein